MLKLAQTTIRVNGRRYSMTQTPAGRPTGIWTTPDHESFIQAPRSYIGTRNPFLLFKQGERSRTWFAQHDNEKRQDLLNRLLRDGEPGFNLGSHLQLVKCPEGAETPFKHNGMPIQILGRCPGCRGMPNPSAG